MVNKPDISVIMPVYNAQKYVKKAIESILNQTMKDFELIIIDDCGQDDSMHIVREIRDDRIKIYSNKVNQGIAYSRNFAIHNAKGKYIALMDDDDIAPLKRLETEYIFLERNKDVDVVAGQMVKINENDEMISYPSQVICNPKRIWAELMFRDVIANGSAMFKAEFAKRNNIFYKDGFMGMEDYKFWTECSIKGEIVNLNDVLLLWRNTTENETSQIKKNRALDRKNVYASIQLETLKNNGFHMEKWEQEIFCKCFSEDKKSYISLLELKEVKKILQKLISQAQEIHKDKIKEFEFVCHRMFGMKTENSEIWME